MINAIGVSRSGNFLKKADEGKPGGSANLPPRFVRICRKKAVIFPWPGSRGIVAPFCTCTGESDSRLH
jgi:hypothetical protein